MESMLNFVTKFTDVVRDHIHETSECLGKDVVDSKAKKAGICVDKIKVAYGAKFSMLGHNYKDADANQIERFDEDVLVCQGGNGFFFVPESGIKAMGESVILVDSSFNQPEAKSMSRRKREVSQRLLKTERLIKEVLPKAVESKPRVRKKKRKLSIFY